MCVAWIFEKVRGCALDVVVYLSASACLGYCCSGLHSGGLTSVTTVQWSLRSGLGIKFLTPGGASADFRGGFAVKYERTSILVRVAVWGSTI